MKIKNLKINGDKIKALAGAIILMTSLTACGNSEARNSERKTYSIEESMFDNQNAQYLLVDNELIPITDIRLMDSKGNIIESVDAVIVDGEMMNIENPVEIMFSKDIDSVVINNKIMPVSEFTLANANTKKEISVISGVFVDNKLVSVDTNNNNGVYADENYEVLTNEKFYQLVDEKIEECKEKGIAFDEADIEKLVMFVNINRLLVDNPSLVYQIIGGENLTEAELINVMMDGEMIQDTFNAYNLDLFRETKSIEGFILISDCVFDPAEKEKAQLVESRVLEIGSYARTDVDKMNELITSLLTDLYEENEEVYNMESGTRYGLRYMLRPIRDLFGRNECEDEITLNSTNKDFVKYFVSYVGDENDYYMNGWGTAAYQNVYGLLNSDCKTLSR